MTGDNTPGLGKLVSVHVLSPAHMQRAAFIAVLSFLFFLAMMVAFYLRQNILYFLLATAFMIVYLITMISLVIQRRSVLQVFEGGISYRKNSALWNEISEVRDDGTVVVAGRKPMVISTAINDFDKLMKMLRSKANAR